MTYKDYRDAQDQLRTRTVKLSKHDIRTIAQALSFSIGEDPHQDDGFFLSSLLERFERLEKE